MAIKHFFRLCALSTLKELLVPDSDFKAMFLTLLACFKLIPDLRL